MKKSFGLGLLVTGLFAIGTGLQAHAAKIYQNLVPGVGLVNTIECGDGTTYHASGEYTMERVLQMAVGYCVAHGGHPVEYRNYCCPTGFVLAGSSCNQDVAPTLSCPKGYWVESDFKGKRQTTCVKQAAAANSMPGVAAWVSIGTANGGEYLTDDKGGSRFFIAATTLSCPSRYSLNGNICRKTVAATVKAGTCP